jgi:hypothetical protein
MFHWQAGRYSVVLTNIFTARQMDGWKDGRVGVWMDGWMNVWVDG